MEWENKDANDWRVVSTSYWRSLENYTGLEARAGVYIFANSVNQVKYVGKAGAGRLVLEITSAISRGKDYGATQVKALYTNSETNALSLEKDLINKYMSPKEWRKIR